MRTTYFFSALVLCLLLSCGNQGTKTANKTAASQYDPNSPAVSSKPVSTTASNLPSNTSAGAPTTYNNTTTPRGVDGAIAAPRTYASPAAVAAPVVGTWVNRSDPDETVVFTDHSYSTYYEGQLVVEEEMVYYVSCPPDCSGGQSAGVPCFVISSEYGKDCFGIVRIAENELELSILGLSTETVKYSRVNP